MSVGTRVPGPKRSPQPGPVGPCTRIDVTTTDGRQLTAETRYPRGHRGNPLTDAEVEAKFRGLAIDALGSEGCDRVLAHAWGLEKSQTPDALLESVVVAK